MPKNRARLLGKILSAIVATVVLTAVPNFSAAAQSNSTVTDSWEPFPVLPMAWWNDATDLTAGLWINTGPTSLGTFTFGVVRGFGGFQASTIGETIDFFARLKNPPQLTQNGFTGSVEGWVLEGTTGARVSLARPIRNGNRYMETGGHAEWVATREIAYLDPGLWENAGSVEGAVFHEQGISLDGLSAMFRLQGGGGVAYRFRDAAVVGSRYVTTPFGVVSAEGSVRRRFGPFVAGGRGYAGAFLSADPLPRQRRVVLKGADPHQTLGNPLVRTEGAPFVNGDILYHSPGYANLRGFRADLGGRWAAALNLELEGDLFRQTRGPLRRFSLVAFWDGGVVDTVAVRSNSGRAFRVVADAGVGARAWVDLGKLRFPIRVEFPLYVTEPSLADDRRRGTDFVEFRWLISLQPTF